MMAGPERMEFSNSQKSNDFCEYLGPGLLKEPSMLTKVPDKFTFDIDSEDPFTLRKVPGKLTSDIVSEEPFTSRKAPAKVTFHIASEEPSILTKAPAKLTFDDRTSTTPKSGHQRQQHQRPLPITKLLIFHDNPEYFEEASQETRFGPMGQRPVGTRSIAPVPPRRPRSFKLPPPVPIHQFVELSNNDVIEEQEIDVFLNSTEAEFDNTTPTLPNNEKRESTFGKLTQFFRKSKTNSKGSVGSSSVGSNGSRSRSASSGISSPPFTPDSSLSIYTNSMDSDSHSSSRSQPSTNSDQGHYPEIHYHRPRGQIEDTDSLSPLPVYTNGYIKTGFRARKHSFPISASTFPNRGHISEHPLPSYYNLATNLATFHPPNRRRHSISSGPSSPILPPPQIEYTTIVPSNGTTSGGSSTNGYLVPIQTRPTCSQSLGQGPSKRNLYLNDLPQATHAVESLENIVQVEIHTPTSSHGYSDMFCDSSASTAIPQSVYSNRNAIKSVAQIRNPCSSDSSSTIDATSALSREDSQGAGAQPPANSAKIRREHGLAPTGTGCEQYCKFCTSSSLPIVPPSRSNKMNVGILSCQGCFFSKSAVSQIIKIFETIVGTDRKKINVNIQTYDVQEIGENVKGVELHRAKIQIVVISHTFLDHLRHAASVQKKMSPINRILRAKRVIGVLLSGVGNGGGGVGSSEAGDGFLQCENIILKNLLEFSNWETLELKPSSKLDSEFYKKFTEKVIGIYTVEQRIPAGFSIFPKKVTKFQPEVMICFKKIIENEDIIIVQLGKGRRKEFVTEIKLKNPYSGVIKIPASLYEDNRSILIEITVTLNDTNLGSKALKYDHKSHLWEDEPNGSENSGSENSAGMSQTGSDPVLPPSPPPGTVSPTTPGTLTPAVEYYDMPRAAKQDYCIPPAARPIVPKKPTKHSAIVDQNATIHTQPITSNSSPEMLENANANIQYANIVVTNSDESN